MTIEEKKVLLIELVNSLTEIYDVNVQRDIESYLDSNGWRFSEYNGNITITITGKTKKPTDK